MGGEFDVPVIEACVICVQENNKLLPHAWGRAISKN